MIVHEVEKKFENMMMYFSQKEGGAFLTHAKNRYFKMAGDVDYDTQDFEHKMNSFTEWFLLHYSPFRTGLKIFELYAHEVGLSDLIRNVLESVVYSVFDPLANTSNGRSILYDSINKQKYELKSEYNPFLVIKGELFVGRMLKTTEGAFLLKGIVPMPHEVAPWIKKQCALVQKKQVSYTSEEFCIALEGMKYKTLLYQHINPEKIFSLDY